MILGGVTLSISYFLMNNSLSVCPVLMCNLSNLYVGWKVWPLRTGFGFGLLSSMMVPNLSTSLWWLTNFQSYCLLMIYSPCIFQPTHIQIQFDSEHTVIFTQTQNTEVWELHHDQNVTGVLNVLNVTPYILDKLDSFSCLSLYFHTNCTIIQLPLLCS